MKKKVLGIMSLCLLASIFLFHTTVSAKSEQWKVTINESFKNYTAYTGEEFELWYNLYKGDEDYSSKEQYWDYTLTSSDKSIISVKNKTILLPEKAGTVKITLKNSGVSDTVKMTVLNSGITTQADSKTAVIGRPLSISLRGSGINNSKVKVTINDSKIATLEKTGDGYYTVNGKKEGNVTITAKSGDVVEKIILKVVPKLALKLESYKPVKSNGTVVGYKLTIKNNSKQAVKIIAGRDGDMYGFSDNVLKTPVTIKKNEVKTITVPNKSYAKYIFDSNGKLNKGWDFGINVNYQGAPLSLWFDDNNMISDESGGYF